MSTQRQKSALPSSDNRARARRERERRRRQLRRRRLGVVALFFVLALVSYELLKPGHAPKPRITVVRIIKHNAYVPLPNPAPVKPLYKGAPAGDGVWIPRGRAVHGHTAVFTTTVHLPDQSTTVAGIAWMDSRLLVARLYSGSLSPGGLNWKYTAPVTPAAAKSLTVAFNGGFLMKDTKGGYYAEGKYAAPLVNGAASAVIYKDGRMQIGVWGSDVSMTPLVVAVRQNLVLLINSGVIAPGVTATDNYKWGIALHQVVDTWRSGIGITSKGAVVFAYGQMNVLDLADVLQRAGAVRAMVLDMNPAWTVFGVFTPATAHGEATAANAYSLLTTTYDPSRFFSPAYSRDFFTFSAR